MAGIYFVHWHEAELLELSAPLRAAGHEVVGHHSTNQPPRWEGFEPDVAVISLERLPAHGREVADWVRSAKKRRHVPVVFVGGKTEKVAETRRRFPDATYCAIEAVAKVAADAASHRNRTTRAPEVHVNAAESSKQPSATPLARKLGVMDGVRFALVDPPDGFDRTLAAPRGAVKTKSAGTECGVVVFFARSSRLLTTKLAKLKAGLAPKASLWLAWPKKTSALASDLSDEIVRQLGLRSGLVDVKVCAIDETWSGLKFVHRVKDRPKRSRKSERGT